MHWSGRDRKNMPRLQLATESSYAYEARKASDDFTDSTISEMDGLKHQQIVQITMISSPESSRQCARIEAETDVCVLTVHAFTRHKGCERIDPHIGIILVAYLTEGTALCVFINQIGCSAKICEKIREL